MSKLLLCDSYQFEVKDRPALRLRLSEAMKTGGSAFPLAIPGSISRCGVVNGNNREYPRPVWEKNMLEDSPLQKAIRSNASWGTLEHPADGKITLNSPISHKVSKMFLEGIEVGGELTFVGTAEGQKMAILMDAGYNPTVSTRGYGSVVKDARGVDVVQEDFVCESVDVVFTPSFDTAVLTPQRESLTGLPKLETKVEPAPDFIGTVLAEAIKGGQLKAALAESASGWQVTYPDDSVKSITTLAEAVALIAPASTPSPSPAPDAAGSPSSTTSMNELKALTEAIQAFAATDVAKLDPTALSERLSRADDLHRQVATTAAGHPELAWDAQKLQERLSGHEQAIKAIVAAPSAQVKSLTEQQGRVLKAVKLVTEMAVGYKSKLGKALVEAKDLKTLSETLTTRGQGWQKRALLAEKRVEVAYQALDEMKARYHEDTTAMGRKLIHLEFKPTDEKIIEALEGAVTASDLVPIRDGLKKTLSESKGAGKSPLAEDKTEKKPSNPPVAKSDVKPTKLEAYAGDRPHTWMEGVQMASRMGSAALLVG